MRAEEVLVQAREAVVRGDRQSALEAYDRLITMQPVSLEAIFERAAVLEEMGRTDEAETGYMQVIQAVPNQVPALMRLGHLCRKKGDRKQSLVYFQRAVAANPNHVAAHMQVAYDLRDLGQADDAEKTFSRVLELAPNNTGALIGLGYLARARGDRARSLGFFERAVAAQPDQAEPHLQIGYDLRELGRFGEAKSAFLNVLALAPDHLGALLALGFSARHDNLRAQSLAYFRRAVEAHPQDIAANLQVAHDLAALQDFDGAVKQFERVLQLWPGHEEATKRLDALVRLRADRVKNPAVTHGPPERDVDAAIGSAIDRRMQEGHRLLDLDRHDEAEQAFAHVLSLKPDHVDALAALGRLARVGGNHAGALSFFELAAAADPHDLNALVQTAYELHQLGRHREAEDKLLKLLEIAPDHVPALMALGHVARASNDRTRSLGFFERAAAQEPQHVEARLQAAYDLRELGRSTEADTLFQEVVSLHPGHTDALVALGWSARKRGEHDKSFAYFQAAAIADPECTAAEGERVAGLRDQDRTEETRASINERIQGGANDINAWSLHIQSCMSSGDMEMVVQLLQQPPEARSSHEKARVLLAKAQFAEARWQLGESADLYRGALALNPEDEFTRLALGRISLFILDVDAAKAHLSRASRTPDFAAGEASDVRSRLAKLLEELDRDRGLLEQLKEISGASPVVRIRLLRELVRRTSDKTTPAILLLFALGEAGLLEHFAAEAVRSSERAIPKRVAHLGEELSPLPGASRLLQSWRQHHPDYELILFNDTSARDMIAANFGTDVLQAYIRSRHPGQKAELFGLAFVCAKGGFCLENSTSSRCLASLESVVPAGAEFVAQQGEVGVLNNNFIGAVSGHAVTRRAIELATGIANRDDFDPGLLTRAFTQVLADARDPSAWLRPNVILNRWRCRRIITEGVS